MDFNSIEVLEATKTVTHVPNLEISALDDFLPAAMYAFVLL